VWALSSQKRPFVITTAATMPLLMAVPPGTSPRPYPANRVNAGGLVPTNIDCEARLRHWLACDAKHLSARWGTIFPGCRLFCWADSPAVSRQVGFRLVW